MNKNLLLSAGLIVLAVVASWLVLRDREPAVPEETGSASSQYKYGEAILEVGKTAEFPHVIVTPLEVTEDSRCAEGLQCLWAGTVKVRVNASKPSGNFTEVVEVGKSLTTGTEKVEFVSVSPAPRAEASIPSDEYRLVFKVTQEPIVSENPGTGECFVGGCSGQICSEESGAISTCEFRAEYSCYKTAKCERQPSGQCGWTETAELKMCLQNATL